MSIMHTAVEHPEFQERDLVSSRPDPTPYERVPISDRKSIPEYGGNRWENSADGAQLRVGGSQGVTHANSVSPIADKYRQGNRLMVMAS